MIKLVRELPVLSLRLVRTTGLAAALAAGVAGAQTDGVVFVEDIEQQAQRMAQQTAAARSSQFQVPAPSQQSRFPQPTVKGWPNGGQQLPLKQQLQQKKLMQQQEEKSGWSLKKTLGGLFGANKREQSPQIVPPQAPAGRTGSMAAMPANAPKQSLLGARPSQPGASSQSNQRSARPTLFGGSDNGSSTPDMRGRSLAASSKRGSNKPGGLFSMFGGDGQQGAEQSDAPSAPIASMPMGQPNTGPARSPRMPGGDEMVAMVTDREERKAPQVKMPLPTNPSAAMSASTISDANEAPLPMLTHRSAPTSMPAAKLPVVTTPSVSSDTLQASNREVQSTAVQQPMPRPMNSIQQVAAEQPDRGPKEIVNQHAMAKAAAMARSMPAASSMPAKSAPKQPVTVAQNIPYPTAQPANPVAPPEADSAQPSAKAIELLTAANQLSTTAKTEEELTQVVQLCRHVLAIDNSQVCIDYSHNLASWALNRRGEVRTDEGRIKEALLDFEDALRLDPERYRAIHNRGVLAAQAGRFADAFDDFNRTIELNPDFAKAYSNRGALWMRAGELEKSSADYRQAIALDPDLAVAHKGRGRVCHMLGQFTLALQHMDAAAHLSPEDAHIACNRGDLLMDMGRYRSARADYQRAIELDSSLIAAHRNLAWLQATCPDSECRDARQAIATAQHALQLCSEPSDLEYDTLAAAYAAAGDFDAAQAAMEKCLATASEKDKPNYEWRKQLYAKGQPYITEPASDVQQASYAE
ncbi:tetratricopeptide repeat protein [Aeoliella sp. ICT_H6.2]|uniref:Tetratricopeptide repeat protein n=1 Tax=Aeoliella straminimaris TaxID=2954799 RepID=A0A9X2F8Z4_9BACT|nr:tetratricopeptide repeat protein [Aeoliella straminimaris]MCO6043807.1 tetratricopeptide repeat protein [Aeoliella straminimaris]